jgi:uncharacterized membrane protein YcjF (UPF0283 family)
MILLFNSPFTLEIVSNYEKVSSLESSVKKGFSRADNGIEEVLQKLSSIEDQAIVDEIIKNVNQLLDRRMDTLISNFNLEDSVVEKIETSAVINR